jgi:hypothetical protein
MAQAKPHFAYSNTMCFRCKRKDMNLAGAGKDDLCAALLLTAMHANATAISGPPLLAAARLIMEHAEHSLEPRVPDSELCKSDTTAADLPLEYGCLAVR